MRTNSWLIVPGIVAVLVANACSNSATDVITIRFAMWDAGNALYDSTVLIDNFQWIASGGGVAVGTTPAQ
ncbi:MAG TPA: hypothetical protein VIY73_24065 [Polyangiaceae bacterium]